MDKEERDRQAVQARFDGLAHRYDKTLETAKCFASDFILDAFRRHRPEQAQGSLDILDLGCGTGMCGKALKPYARRLDGVDLSEKMLEKALGLGVYDHLFQGDIPTHLQQSSARYHLITVASVFLYFAQLEATIEGCRSVLHAGGMLIFTVDRHPEPGPDVAPNPRNPLMYSHGRDYVQRCLVQAGLTLTALEDIDERLAWKDLAPIPALLAVSVRSA